MLKLNDHDFVRWPSLQQRCEQRPKLSVVPTKQVAFGALQVWRRPVLHRESKVGVVVTMHGEQPLLRIAQRHDQLGESTSEVADAVRAVKQQWVLEALRNDARLLLGKDIVDPDPRRQVRAEPLPPISRPALASLADSLQLWHVQFLLDQVDLGVRGQGPRERGGAAVHEAGDDEVNLFRERLPRSKLSKVNRVYGFHCIRRQPRQIEKLLDVVEHVGLAAHHGHAEAVPKLPLAREHDGVEATRRVRLQEVGHNGLLVLPVSFRPH
mmetsp:Transcript_85527/g.245626  ORF Transcript_85527/g.245626 Transcript_85527/m.245626 type:complete len:267 (-) Transcript_85527:434-1234(-)